MVFAPSQSQQPDADQRMRQAIRNGIIALLTSARPRGSRSPSSPLSPFLRVPHQPPLAEEVPEGEPEEEEDEAEGDEVGEGGDHERTSSRGSSASAAVSRACASWRIRSASISGRGFLKGARFGIRVQEPLDLASGRLRDLGQHVESRTMTCLLEIDEVLP